MKKLLLGAKLTLLAFFLSYSSGVAAQEYEADEASPLITVVNTNPDETQLTSNCTWALTDTANDNMQPFNNRAFYSEGNYLGTLIDNDLNTYWHSDPNNMYLRAQDEWIQVDLKRTDIQRFFFRLHRREDMYNGSPRYGVTPTRLEIKATNTPDDAASWTDITVLTQIPPSATGTWPYETLIDMEAPYQYIRLIPRTAGQKVTNEYDYWTFSELQFYEAKKIEDRRVVLSAVLDSVADKMSTYAVGTLPGYFPQEAVDTYSSAFDAALAVNDNSAATQDEIGAAIVSMREAGKVLMSSVNPITDGYYTIANGDSAFQKTQKKNAVLTGGEDYLNWEMYDATNARQVFKITKLENGNYSVQNLFYDNYIATAPGDATVSSAGTHVKMTAAVENGQVFEALGNGYFYMENDSNKYPYHPLDHGNGVGKTGAIVPAYQYIPISTWGLQPIDEATAIKLKGGQAARDAAAALIDSTKEARRLVFDMKDPKGLLTTADQLSSNCLWQSDHDVDKLIDKDRTTYFHSSANEGKDLYKDDEWLQVNLKRNDVQKFIIEYWGRGDGEASGNEWHDNPNHFVIEGTNNVDDDNSWTQIADLTTGFPDNVHNAHYVSNLIDMGTPYQYLRFHVKGTTSGYGYWNIAELQLFEDGYTPSDNSIYAKNADVKNAVDVLDKSLAIADDHINNLTVDGTEMDAIRKQTVVINDVIKNFDEIQKVVNNANALYPTLFIYKPDTAGLIKVVNTLGDGTNQLQSNSTWMGITSENDNYSFNQAFIDNGYNLLGTLIDGDDQTYWHSDPNGVNLTSQPSYLQMDLQRSDISKFVFSICRRNDLYNGANRHGIMPGTALIYGTNDDAIGQDVSSPSTSWTKITTITGMPSSEDNSISWPYHTAEITDGNAYRYLRFQCTIANPRSTYWCISGFQVFEGDKKQFDTAISQYSLVEGMKAAADNMKSLSDQLQANLNEHSATKAQAEELQKAIDAVKALYQDQSANDELIAAAQRIVDNTDEGEDMGFIRDASLLDALQSAIDAAKKPQASTETFKANYKALSEAYEAALASVVSPVPGKWYYIKSDVNDELSSTANYYPAREAPLAGVAMYVLSDGGKEGKGDVEGDYHEGQQLRWGMDDVKGKDTEGDVDALWRFVPVPDSLNLGPRAYYIQNMRTGWYVQGGNAGSDSFHNAGSSPYAFRLIFIGQEQFVLQSLDERDPHCGEYLELNGNARQIHSSPVDDYRAATSWTFEEFNTEDAGVIMEQFRNNSVNIVCLPFAVSDLPGLNGNLKTYTVLNNTTTTIDLGEKLDFAAGEPFVMIIGDPSAEDHSRVDVALNIPTDLTQKADTANGLIGTFNWGNIKSKGLGYIENDSLKAINETDTIFTVPTQSGFFVSGLCENLGGDVAYTLEVTNGGLLTADPRDLNGDGKVDSDDVTRLLEYIQGLEEDSKINSRFDLNKDGKVGSGDVSNLLEHIQSQEAKKAQKAAKLVKAQKPEK